MHKTRKRFAFLVVLLLIFQYINPNLSFTVKPFLVHAEEAIQNLEDVPEGFIGIYSASDLNDIRNDLSGKYILMNNIDLTSSTSEGGEFYNAGNGWKPIGSEGLPFTGILNGNGYKIDGMKINMVTNDKAFAGLFGYAVGAEISDLGMDGSSIKVDNQATDSALSDSYAGGIIGYGKDIKISNSYNTGEVEAFSLFDSYAGGLIAYIDSSYNKNSAVTNSYNTGVINAKTYSAGIVGRAYRTELTQIENTGNINLTSSNSKYTGGIIGYGSYVNIIKGSNQGDIKYVDYGGGIAGYVSNSTIDSSENFGNLNSSNGFSIGGGIAGNIRISSSISNTRNEGNISSTAEHSDGGGIVGQASSNSTIINNSNQGDVSVSSAAGGIAGEQFSSIIVQSYNSGKMKGFYAGGINGYNSGGTIKDSFNIGSILGTYIAGGIVGDASTTIIQNTYNVGIVSKGHGTGFSGAIAGEFDGNLIHNYYLDNNYEGVGEGIDEGTYKKTFAEMKSPTTFNGFDFSTTWTTNQNPQYQFPVLKNLELVGQEIAAQIKMKSLPEKITYVQGEELDLTGASIKILTNFGNLYDTGVTKEMVSNYYKDEARTQQIIVTYEGVKTAFNITVEKDVTPPAKPIVKPVTDRSTNIYGEGEPGSTIWVKDGSRNNTIGKGTVTKEGTFNIAIPVQKSGRRLLVSAMDKYYNWSEAVEVWVEDTIPPEKPIVNKVTDLSTSITGTAEEAVIINARVGEDQWSTVSDYYGGFEISIPSLKAGTVIDIWASDFSENESEIIQVTVVDETAPVAPLVNELTDFDKTLSGTAEPNSTIVATVSGKIIGQDKAKYNGKFSITISKQTAGNLIEVVASDSAGNTSIPTLLKVIDQKPKLEELAGSTRYSTAVKISKSGWSSSNTVFLVNGWAIADGLTATPLASTYNSPILLTTKDAIPVETMQEIDRLKAKEIIIIGGTSVISTDLESELISNGYSVSRIGGKNRYNTSLLIAQELDKKVDVQTVYMAYGFGEPDALSIAAQAGQTKQPIILTEKTSIPTETFSWLEDEKLLTSYFIGGESVIDSSIINKMNKITTRVVLSNRLSGANRQDTNAKVIEAFYKQSDIYTIMVAHSDTLKLVDALAAGPLAAKLGVPVLLVSSKGMNSSQVNEIKPKQSEMVHQIGGGINKTILDQLANFLN